MHTLRGSFDMHISGAMHGRGEQFFIAKSQLICAVSTPSSRCHARYVVLH